MELRKYKSADCDEILKLFHDTVHCINAKDYTQEQLDVWANGKADISVWDISLTHHYTVVAWQDGVIVGFGDIDGDYLDRLYVHKDYQKIGIATALSDELEEYARKNNKSQITTHASITACNFFKKRGYVAIKEQQVERGGIHLTNFIMIKDIVL